MATAISSLRSYTPGRRAVGLWLLAVALLIAAMVTVGGLTRLTGSGLSITEWHPVTGVVPPLSDQTWQAEFAKYQRIPQYQLQNRGMSLGDFKAIYWWEWSHRLLGRLLGFVFFVPFLFFAFTGAIQRSGLPRMVVLFALGGLQGFVGWWMVESGLETRVSVSQYRLAIHLGVAFILLGAILWTAFEYLRTRSSSPTSAGLSGESASAMQTSLFARHCNPRWVHLALPRRSGSSNPRVGETNSPAKRRNCNLRESFGAISATEKLSPDSPARAGEVPSKARRRGNITISPSVTRAVARVTPPPRAGEEDRNRNSTPR